MLQENLKIQWSEFLDSVSSLETGLSAESAKEYCLALSTIQTLEDRGFVSEEDLDEVAHVGDSISKTLVSSYLSCKHFCPGLARLAPGYAKKNGDPFAYLMQLIDLLDGRKSRGVFYTPMPLARYVVRSGIKHLAEVGIAIDQIKLLEPSVGTGVFIASLIRELAEFNCDNAVITALLAQTVCVDISPAAIVIAQLLLVAEFRRQGIPRTQAKLPLFIAGDTLSAQPDPIYRSLNLDVENLAGHIREKTFNFVVGNPPFGSLAAPTDDWTQQLLHGDLKNTEGQRSYFKVNGQKLGERKSWLHDNYVKFTRLAHWQIEKSNAGCLALVLNSGFISNLSFRGMRYQLVDTFDQIDVTDFGGDQRNQRNLVDENLFGIETGIATLVASHSSSKRDRDSTTYTRLTGPRNSKLAWCLDKNAAIELSNLKLTKATLSPQGPNYRFDRTPGISVREFQSGTRLDELFTKKWSIPVTARDHLVVHWTAGQLKARIRRFLSKEKSTEQIRSELFPPARSNRFPRGDSRSWKLQPVREQLEDSDWESWIRPCVYRPFDHRYILWNPLVIDWPRTDLIESLKLADNLCLVTRRQAPPEQDYSYFWSTKEIPLDGLVRSDNRGNEYCYPLYREVDGRRESNMSTSLVAALKSVWQLDDLDPALVYYIMQAVFHSSDYRNRFKEPLAEETPRVFFPQSFDLANQLGILGKKIVEYQLDGIECTTSGPTADNRVANSGRQKITFREGWLTIPNQKPIPMDEWVWQYRVGSHQLVKKYTNYRIKAGMDPGLADDVRLLGEKIKRFEAVKKEIDARIQLAGGLDNSFFMKGIPNAVPN